MLYPDAELGDQAVEGFVFRAEFFAARFFLGLKNDDTWQGEALKAGILD